MILYKLVIEKNKQEYLNNLKSENNKKEEIKSKNS